MTSENLLITQPHGKAVVVYITIMKVLDENTINRLGDELADIVSRNSNGTVLLNFKDVTYLSSAVIGKLVSLHKKASVENCVLLLCSISPQIMRIFEITKLNKVFRIFPSEQAAWSAVGI